jgi:tripartite-type tricarboxylate transporter receptor subunit TctC
MTHIPYRGATPAFNDLIPGRVDVMFNLITSSLPLIRGGQIRGIAVASAKRAAVLPDLPTIAESGLPGYDMSSWIGLFVPARTPAEIVRKIHADTVAAVTDPATRKKLESMGVEPVGSSPSELAAQIRADQERWGPVIREAGISIRD